MSPFPVHLSVALEFWPFGMLKADAFFFFPQILSELNDCLILVPLIFSYESNLYEFILFCCYYIFSYTSIFWTWILFNRYSWNCMRFVVWDLESIVVFSGKYLHFFGLCPTSLPTTHPIIFSTKFIPLPLVLIVFLLCYFLSFSWFI